MKSLHLVVYLLSVAVTTAFSIPALPSYLSSQADAISNIFQRPLSSFLPGPLNPFTPSAPETDMPSSSSDDLMISDVIARERSINVFAGFTRDVDPVQNRLDNQSQNSTILAPLNSAIQQMDRKPWEDPKEYATFGQEAYGMGDGEGRAHKNLGRFVEAHVVTTSPWKEGEKVETMAGTKVWWEMQEGKKVVCLAFQCFDFESRC